MVKHRLISVNFFMRVTPDIDFADEVIGPYYVPVAKILLQVLVVYK